MLEYMVFTQQKPKQFPETLDKALLNAVKENNKQITDSLLQAGADPNYFAYEGYGYIVNVLYIAVSIGNVEIVRLLLERGAKPNNEFRNDCAEYYTPLYCAADNGNETLVRLLLQYGADPCIKSRTSKSPLDTAVDHGYLNIAQLLIKHMQQL